MLSIRTSASASGSISARKPSAREQKPQGLQASFRNARELADQVHHWYVAAHHHLAQAHQCDQQIVRLQDHMRKLENTLGRASPILLGAGAPLLGIGEALHAGVVSHSAIGILATGIAGTLAWLGSAAGLKKRIAQLTDKCAEAQDQTQTYTRLAQALDPDRKQASAQPHWMQGLRAPRLPR
jgi:hypothetical protein